MSSLLSMNYNGFPYSQIQGSQLRIIQTESLFEPSKNNKNNKNLKNKKQIEKNGENEEEENNKRNK